mmetsp:Transcript_33/g.118  ORF Transcript_33/g.118 Transcript_33/m.118 type:complete len:600 (-) Transcript_33:145-1944(-)
MRLSSGIVANASEAIAYLGTALVQTIFSGHVEATLHGMRLPRVAWLGTNASAGLASSPIGQELLGGGNATEVPSAPEGPHLLVPVMLGFAVLFLLLLSLLDSQRRKETEEQLDIPSRGGSLPEWSTFGILALTSYRFYTGFLGATWMPYLLAMEGANLMGERQPLFMGSAKLIYGLSVMLNPIFGLLADQLGDFGVWTGRHAFVIVGVGSAGLGIYGCLVAAHVGSIPWYLLSTTLWMFGEAIADVTTEVLVPELLPPSQYEFSSSLRGLNFVLGGLVGYILLLFSRDLHYNWIYYAYLVVMFLTAAVTLLFLNMQDKSASRSQAGRRPALPLRELFIQAYVLPTRIRGGFPRACLCIFVFSLGASPIFFLLLLVRDIIGIGNGSALQWHFALISIAFYVSAAAAAVLPALSVKTQQSIGSHIESSLEGGAEAAAGGPSNDPLRLQQENEVVRTRWRSMILWTVAFGMFLPLIPLDAFWQTVELRMNFFYLVAILIGGAFGSVYCKFQECTWSLLPEDSDAANALGFASMCKLLGVGVGNFVGGVILNSFVGSDSSAEARSALFYGYLIQCSLCSTLVLLSAYGVHTVAEMAMATKKVS